jgi:malate synthase
MPAPNQIEHKREDVHVTAADLLAFGPEKPITEAGLRRNISVGVHYLGAWLAGSGAVPIFNLMEDATTAEISRGQVWQWIRSPKGCLEDGRKVTKELFREMLMEEVRKVKSIVGSEQWAAGKYPLAADLFDKLTTSDTFIEFLTLPGYDCLEEGCESDWPWAEV